jgi:hypothetical protein
MFAAAMALIAGLERQRIIYPQRLTAARALADVREGFRFLADEPLLGPLTFLLVAWVAIYVPAQHPRSSRPGSTSPARAPAPSAIINTAYYSRTPEEPAWAGSTAPRSRWS